jgi:hypothetical protein
MKDIEIKYNQKQAKFGLFIGLLFLVFGIITIFYGTKPAYFSFGIGFVNIAFNFYRKYVNYLIVTNGFIKKDFGLKILIEDIVETKRFAGDYTFKSKSKKIVIDKNAVDKNSIDDIENLINNIRAGNYQTSANTR